MSKSTPSSVPEDRLPDYFPKIVKECKVEADAFFKCFSDNSKKNDASDKNAGVRGLTECRDLKWNYENCMSKVDSSKLSKRFEVNELRI